MRRLTDERGAVALVVALLLVPLLGFAALAVDTAVLYASRTQLLTASDAGALAVAADCARGTCGDPTDTASTLTALNSGGRDPRTETRLTDDTATVTVHDAVDLVFAPVLGIDVGTVTASTTARWAPLSSVTTPLPFAISVCERPGAEGVPTGDTPRVVRQAADDSCEGPAGAVRSGLVVLSDTAGCAADVTAGDTLDVAEDAPPGCGAVGLDARVGSVVPVPVFDQLSGTGAGSTLHVLGIAGFHLRGWSTGPRASSASTAAACGDQICLDGWFTGYAALDSLPSDTANGAPDLGARAVLLSR